MAEDFSAGYRGEKMARKRIYTEEKARLRKNERQREYVKRTGGAASNKYNKEHTKDICLRLMINTESDIIEELERQDNKNGYIKRLIREDIARRKGE